MAYAKPTPGPWVVRKTDTTFNVQNSAGIQVVRTSWHDRLFTVFPSKAVSLANARLAAAAPDMFEALMMAREAFVVSGSMPLSDEDTLALIDAALAKALGKEA